MKKPFFGPVDFVFLMLFLGLIATGLKLDAQTMESSLRQALATRTQALGVCNAELGQLQQISAQVIDGRLATGEAWKARFEAANPGKTVNDQLVVEDKPAK